MRDFIEFATEVIAPVIVITLFLLLVVALPIVGLALYGAHRQATVYNAIHGTTFTAGDFFWAGSQINSQTQTIKLNNQTHE